jgi:hypothetical protein
MTHNFWLHIKKHATLPNMDAYVEKDNREDAIEHFIALIKEKSGDEVTKEQIDEYILLEID